MTTALLLKEWKESRPLAAVAVVAAVLAIAAMSGATVAPRLYNASPQFHFVSDDHALNFWLVCGGFALLLGLKQTAWEDGRGTYYFLLHHPIARDRVIGLKLACGLVATTSLAILFVLGHSLVAAVPGIRAMPFAWEMTLPAWADCLGIPPLYLSAFLAGIRPGRWFGTKLLPVALGVFVAFLVAVTYWWVDLPVVLLTSVALTAAIFHIARSRDY